MPNPPPRAAPLPSLASLLAWSPTARPDDAFCRASVPLRRGQPTLDTLPRVLAAHDLAGGYGPDAAPQGRGAAPPPAPLFYRCTHAAASLDAIVYFSHARVTIPPPGWTDTAHEGGVRCLGTLIFEHAEGAAEVGALAADTALAGRTAAALASLAAWFGFDGWLVNVEAAVADGAAAAGVVAFVAALDAAMRRERHGGEGGGTPPAPPAPPALPAPPAPPAPLVIWYDALSAVDGSITWRNRLCPAHNGPFFAAAGAGGGLWANYGWGRGDLAASAAAARDAGRPAREVWMGADAWGRGSHGGGGPGGVATAARTAAGAGASLAVFAPGWAWEGPHAGGPARCTSRSRWTSKLRARTWRFTISPRASPLARCTPTRQRSS